jgi:hypothetical protein
MFALGARRSKHSARSHLLRNIEINFSNIILKSNKVCPIHNPLVYFKYLSNNGTEPAEHNYFLDRKISFLLRYLPTPTNRYGSGQPTVNVSRNGFGFWWHVWLALGLNRGRGHFFNCLDAPILLAIFLQTNKNIAYFITIPDYVWMSKLFLSQKIVCFILKTYYSHFSLYWSCLILNGSKPRL